MLNKNPNSKRKILTATPLLTLLVAALAVSLFVNLAAANPIAYSIPGPTVEVTALNTDTLTLTFSVRKAIGWWTTHEYYTYSISSVAVWVDGKLWSQHEWGTSPISVSLEGLSDGWHTVKVTGTAVMAYKGKSYDSKSSSRVIEFQVDTPPPSVQVQSAKSTAVNKGDFQIVLRVVGRTLSWVRYSLDGKENVTVNPEVLVSNFLTPHIKAWAGNLTLVGLSSGSHGLVVYAKDQSGNTGAAITKEFTVVEEAQAPAQPTEPLQTTLLLTVSGVPLAIIVMGLLLYLKKRKR